MTRNGYEPTPNVARAHGSVAAMARTLSTNAANHGTARRGPSDRIAYAGTRKAHTSPGVVPVMPPPTMCASGTQIVPPVTSATTYRSNRPVHARTARFVALNSASARASTMLSGWP